MQPQGDVRIFGRILRRTVHVDLVKGDLLRALARDVFVVNGFDSQILLGRRIHVVTRGHTVEHIRLQHGIVALPAQRDPVVCKYVRIELEVMPELGNGGIFDHRLERGQHSVAIELLRYTSVIVAEWHVSRFPGRDRKGQPDEPRAHVIQAVGLGVEGHERRRCELGKPEVQGLLRYDLAVVARLRQLEERHRRRARRGARIGAFARRRRGDRRVCQRNRRGGRRRGRGRQ